MVRDACRAGATGYFLTCRCRAAWPPGCPCPGSIPRHANPLTHTPPPPLPSPATHAHTRAHTRTHTRARAHTHAHTRTTTAYFEGIGQFRTFSADAVIWHKPGAPENGRVTYDDLFDRVWRSSIHTASAVSGVSGGSGGRGSRGKKDKDGGKGEGKGEGQGRKRGADGAEGGGEEPAPPFDMSAYIAHEVGERGGTLTCLDGR